jgi:hypothetical protein
MMTAVKGDWTAIIRAFPKYEPIKLNISGRESAERLVKELDDDGNVFTVHVVNRVTGEVIKRQK